MSRTFVGAVYPSSCCVIDHLFAGEPGDWKQDREGLVIIEFGCVAPAGETAKFDEVLGLATGTLGNETLSESILLVAREMLANIREHQYHNDVTPPIAMSIFITRREVIVTIIDVGQEWRDNGYYDEVNAGYKLRVLAEEGAQRGRGQLIMAILASSIRYLHGGRVRQLAFHR